MSTQELNFLTFRRNLILHGKKALCIKCLQSELGRSGCSEHFSVQWHFLGTWTSRASPNILVVVWAAQNRFSGKRGSQTLFLPPTSTAHKMPSSTGPLTMSLRTLDGFLPNKFLYSFLETSNTIGLLTIFWQGVLQVNHVAGKSFC